LTEPAAVTSPEANLVIARLQRAIARVDDVPEARSLPEASMTLAYLVNQLRSLLPWAVHRTRQHGVRRLAVYGAGSHTRLLLPMWRALGGPPVTVIVVSGEPAASACCGLPVESIDRFNGERVDGVLLSSQGFEKAMAATCAKRMPSLRVFSVWSPSAVDGGLDVPATNAVIPVCEPHAETLYR
jgi:hypothetical protein